MSIQPLFYEYLQRGANSPLLNPPNEDQSRFSIYFGKPLRAIVRLIYSLICGSIIPLIGVFFHLLKSFDQALMSRSARGVDKDTLHSNALKHLKGAGIDGLFLLINVFALLIFRAKNRVNLNFSQLVGFKGDFLKCAMVMGILSPLTFACVPDLFKSDFIIH